MHIEWLNEKISDLYFILAASRSDKIIICSVDPTTLKIKKER